MGKLVFDLMPPKDSLIVFDNGAIWKVTKTDLRRKRAIIRPATREDVIKAQQRREKDEQSKRTGAVNTAPT